MGDVVPATSQKSDNYRTFDLRRQMLQAACKDLKNTAVSTIQKDLEIENISTIEQSMVYWRGVAKFCLDQVDHVVVGTRGEPKAVLRALDNLYEGSEGPPVSKLNLVQTTNSLSSTRLRRDLVNVMSQIANVEVLGLLASRPDILKNYATPPRSPSDTGSETEDVTGKL